MSTSEKPGCKGAMGWHRAGQAWQGGVWGRLSDHQQEEELEGRRSITKRNLGHKGWALDMQPGDRLRPEETC